ncbi:peptidase M23 [Streptomyces sp. NPDC001668]|uniref:peptidase M23 n=1 Tax=Streptomyces sp. NPDC001668 TaxID=3364598 RepID=UPI00369A71FE
MQQDLGQIAVTVAAKKTLTWKIAIAAGVCFLAALMLMGALLPAPSAAASSCEDTGVGTGSATPVTDNASTGSSSSGSGSVHDKQIANAQAIDNVAIRLHLPGKATLIAMMTAMQESSLLNQDTGHLDSVGLFQQRPSMGWGSKANIMKPAYAAESFFKGRGTNQGLIDIKNWTTRPPGDVAQAVQHSKYPSLYAGHESEVRALAKEADIDLARAGSATGTSGDNATASSGDDSTAASGDVPSQCPTNDTVPGSTTGASSGTFTDGKNTVTLHNPRTVKEAIRWARLHSGALSTPAWYRRCLAFVANVYGWSFSGVDYAIDHYKVVPANMRHPGDRHPPPGALLYWDTGHRAGHIAVYLGNGEIASNDIVRPGYIDVVKADEIENRWGANYVGWTPPVFPRAG